MTDWTSTSGNVTVAVGDDRVATIALNRPEKLNALTDEMLLDLASAIRHHGNDGRATGVVITGTGRVFSAGEDLEVAAALGEHDITDAIERFNEITRVILSTEVPVVAALNGLAVGGASELTLCCDSRVAARSAGYYLPENSRGLTISNASSILLPRMVGSRAMRLVLDSERITADEALRIGLVDAVVDDADLMDHVYALVREWTSDGRATKEHLQLMRPRLEDLEPAMRREAKAALAAWRRGTTTNGVAKFLSRDRDALPS